MRRPLVLGAALILAGTTTMGVSAVSPSPEPPVSVTATPSVGEAGPFPDLDAIFAPTEPPIDLVVRHAETDRVEADVPLEGGVVEATGTDGTRYTLTIPADALLEATRIGMAPLSAVEGLPVGGEVTYGVQLAPDGLVLLQPAILRIEPATALAPEEQVPFGYDHDGAGMFIAEPVVDSAAIDIVVSHFSGYGVTKGLLADTRPVRERLGGSAERRLASQLAQSLGAERQRQLAGGQAVDAPDLTALFDEAFARYEAEVLGPRLAAAGQSCANARVAIETLLGYERQRALLGFAESSTGGMSRVASLMDVAAGVCMKEEYETCRDQHVLHLIIPAQLTFERQRQLLGSENPGQRQEDEAYVKRCLTFRVDFESNVTVESQGVSLEPSVRAKVELTYDPGAFRISGTATEEMFRYRVKVPRCGTTEHAVDSTMDIESLSWTVTPTIWQPERGRIEDFAMTYVPGFPHESFTLKCPRAPAIEMPLSMWYPAYVVTHRDQWEGQSGRVRSQAIAQGVGDGLTIDIRVPAQFSGEMRLTGWEVQEAPLVARQTWSKKAYGGRVQDVGSFEIFHTPG